MVPESVLIVFNSITQFFKFIFYSLLQAMCELADLISYESSSLGRPSATALRGVYSLLGAGGAQFPSLVLDIDSTQT